MYATTGLAYREDTDAVLVLDKRARNHQPTPREGEWLPIGELGSKAIYQVHARRFSAATADS
jgi:hypothetical protein